MLHQHKGAECYAQQQATSLLNCTIAHDPHEDQLSKMLADVLHGYHFCLSTSTTTMDTTSSFMHGVVRKQDFCQCFVAVASQILLYIP